MEIITKDGKKYVEVSSFRSHLEKRRDELLADRELKDTTALQKCEIDGYVRAIANLLFILPT